MAFPRFTKGRAGGLTFDTMNEVFDRIEALEAAAGTGSSRSRAKMHPFLAQLITLKAGTTREWSFQEITYPVSFLLSVAKPVVRGGRSSSDGIDQFAYPAVGDGMSPGQVVLLFPMNRDSSTIVGQPVDPKNGKLMFHAMQIPASDIVAQVVGAAQIATGRWLYNMQRCEASSVPGGVLTYSIAPGEPVFTALNGAENASDSAGSYGVGSAPPGAVTSLVRNAIKNGVVTTLTQDRNGIWSFCIPNGYSVTC